MRLSDKQKMDLLLLFVVGIGVGLAIGMTAHLFLNQKEKEEERAYKIETEELTDCKKEAKLYYDGDNQKVYLYCLNSVKVEENGNLLELKNYYSNHSNILEEMINDMHQVSSYDDGGSILYQDNHQLTENGISVLKCNTINGNRDIYIGPASMGYESGFCQDDKDDKSIGAVKNFIRTYSVLNVSPSNDIEYLYVTLRQFQEEEVVTVKIPSNLANSLQKNKNYEFQFQASNAFFEDTISSIFENAILISVQETDRVGLDQIQEPI